MSADMERRLRRQIDELEQEDMEEFDDNDFQEPTYSVYLMAHGADEGTWGFASLDYAYEAYLLAEKIFRAWTLDSGYRPEEGDGAFLYNSSWGEIVAEYRV